MKQQLYSPLSPISKSIQINRTRHAGHCWRSKSEIISDVLLWTPSHGRASVGRPTRTYLQQLCTDTWCSLEDLPGAIDEWWEIVREIRASSATWLYIYIYIYIYIVVGPKKRKVCILKWIGLQVNLNLVFLQTFRWGLDYANCIPPTEE